MNAARAPTPAPAAKPIRHRMLELDAAVILLPDPPVRRAPRDELEHDALKADIRARGQDRPVRVRARKDGRFDLVTGPEILAACLELDAHYPVLAIVMPLEQTDELGRIVARLSDHAHRSELRTWELAETFHRLTRPPHSLSFAQIAARTGYRDRYVGNLCRLRTKLAPAIWARWSEVGEALPIGALLDVCVEAEADQAEELAAILSGRRRRRGTRKARVSRRAILRRLEELERELYRSEAWCDGAEHALRWVLGERPWRADPDAG